MEVLGWAGTALVVVAYYPQIHHLYVERCAWGISQYRRIMLGGNEDGAERMPDEEVPASVRYPGSCYRGSLRSPVARLDRVVGEYRGAFGRFSVEMGAVE